VLPTEKCNFRCTYCYEDFKIGRMQAPVVRGLKRLISNRAPSLRRLSLSWFGGEPLLAKPVVLEVGTHAYKVARSTASTSMPGSRRMATC
ncbi:MAG TPA: radical SAM protein, partial [Dokdonella sp.]